MFSQSCRRPPPRRTGNHCSHLPIPSLEEHSVRYENLPSPHEVDQLIMLCLVRGHIPQHVFWRNTPTPVWYNKCWIVFFGH